MQVKKLRAIVRHAYENVSFYHSKFRDAGVKPDDVKSVEDLRKMPVTSKTEMQ
jgi:phenylacetate-CoA ligase